MSLVNLGRLADIRRPSFFGVNSQMNGWIGLIGMKKSMLMVAVTLSLMRLHWIIGQIQLMATMQDVPSTMVVRLIGNSLFLLPLPVLFWTLYATNATPLVSGAYRSVTVITAFVEGLLIAIPDMYSLMQGIRRSPQLGWFRGANVAEQFYGWVRNPWVVSLLWGALGFLSQLSLIFFLVSLLRQGKLMNASYRHESRLARRIAAFSVFIGVLVVVLSLSASSYSAFMVYRGRTQIAWLGAEAPNQSVLRGALSLLPQICWTLVAWIVYKGLARPPKVEFDSLVPR